MLRGKSLITIACGAVFLTGLVGILTTSIDISPPKEDAAGARYQLPLTNALIFRADAMVGFLDDASDIHGVRMKLRHKW